MTSSDLVAHYQSLGFRLIYWKRAGDNPRDWKGPNDKGWNDPNRPYPLDAYDPASMNVGVMTGHEIAPGKFLADVDLDWTEGLIFASRFLPPTHFGFGRPGKKLSHAFFTTPEPLPLAIYDDIGVKGTDNGDRFVELRGGDSSHQTMVAPSLHSPGVYVELVLPGDILHVASKQLQTAVLDYAIACLLLRHLPSGLHHDGRLALAGFLLKADFSVERAINIGEAIVHAQVLKNVPDMSGSDILDVPLAVRTTQQRVTAGKKTAGGPKLAEYIGTTGKDVITRIQKWLGHDDVFVRKDGMIIAKNQENIRQALNLLGCELSYDEFAEKPLLNGHPFHDQEVEHIELQIDTKFRFQPPDIFFRKVFTNTAWNNRFHPVKQYLDGLTWDGVPRIDEWLIISASVVDTAYTRAVSSIMLIAAVRRVRKPGCKYDEMVVWESEQGGLKSSAAQMLCPNPSWFSDDLQLNLKSQQLIEATLGKWIVEASDLAGKRKTEIEQLKAMLSRQVDGPARMAYAHFPVERPRHFIIIGTTNSPAYLTDPTGARRFWPVKVSKFDVSWIQQHRDQLWAEAAARESQGESIRLREELWPDAAVQQEARREVDPWEGILRSMLLELQPATDEKRRIATDDIWGGLSILPERRDRHGALRIADIMHRFGFKRTTVRSGGSVVVGYVTDRDGLLESREEPEGTVNTLLDPKDYNPFHNGGL